MLQNQGLFLQIHANKDQVGPLDGQKQVINSMSQMTQHASMVYELLLELLVTLQFTRIIIFHQHRM